MKIRLKFHDSRVCNHFVREEHAHFSACELVIFKAHAPTKFAEMQPQYCDFDDYELLLDYFK